MLSITLAWLDRAREGEGNTTTATTIMAVTVIVELVYLD